MRCGFNFVQKFGSLHSVICTMTHTKEENGENEIYCESHYNEGIFFIIIRWNWRPAHLHLRFLLFHSSTLPFARQLWVPNFLPFWIPFRALKVWFGNQAWHPHLSQRIWCSLFASVRITARHRMPIADWGFWNRRNCHNEYDNGYSAIWIYNSYGDFFVSAQKCLEYCTPYIRVYVVSHEIGLTFRQTVFVWAKSLLRARWSSGWWRRPGSFLCRS